MYPGNEPRRKRLVCVKVRLVEGSSFGLVTATQYNKMHDFVALSILHIRGFSIDISDFELNCFNILINLFIFSVLSYLTSKKFSILGMFFGEITCLFVEIIVFQLKESFGGSQCKWLKYFSKISKPIWNNVISQCIYSLVFSFKH